MVVFLFFFFSILFFFFFIILRIEVSKPADLEPVNILAKIKVEN